MNLRFQIIDTTSGEILSECVDRLVCNLGDTKDVGFKRIHLWAESCVRGIKQKRADSLELRVSFSLEKYMDSEPIPFKSDGIDVY